MSAPTPPPPAPRRRRGCLVSVLLAGLFLSLLLNLGTALVYLGAVANPLEPEPAGVSERFYLGDRDARDKVAVVRVSGVLTGDGIQYPVRQLEAAARDPRVRAVVLRVDTPGGTVTASEELYQNVLNLRDDTGRRFKGTGPKPVSVSMGGLATSGGYYVAASGRPVSAERTTITGSIGVFVALPNVAGWTREHGVRLELIKAGGIKASGSFFHELSPQERQTWQDTVDSAYDRFLEVVAANRPALSVKDLREKEVVDRPIPKRDEKGNPLPPVNGVPQEVRYTRTLADGGTFTAVDAQRFGLVDRIDDLPGAVRAAAAANNLQTFKAVVYDRTPGWLERWTGLPLQGRAIAPQIDDIAATLSPRLWYLAPASDAGLLSGH